MTGYLTVVPIARGKHLIDLLDVADTVDFDYIAIEDDDSASVAGALDDFCSNHIKVHGVRERFAQAKEASHLIQKCATLGMPLSGGTFDRTCYEVDDS